MDYIPHTFWQCLTELRFDSQSQLRAASYTTKPFLEHLVLKRRQSFSLELIFHVASGEIDLSEILEMSSDLESLALKSCHFCIEKIEHLNFRNLLILMLPMSEKNICKNFEQWVKYFTTSHNRLETIFLLNLFASNRKPSLRESNMNFLRNLGSKNLTKEIISYTTENDKEAKVLFVNIDNVHFSVHTSHY